MTKILLVDNEPDILFTTKLMLEREGYEVLTCKNGKECLKYLKEDKPDLVLLDIMMPGLNGWEIGKMIKENKKTRQIPLVMFTICTSKEDMEKSLKYSLADYQINKPFKKEELMNTIERILEKSKDIKDTLEF